MVKSGNSIFLPTSYFTRVLYEAVCSDEARPQLTGPITANRLIKTRVELFFKAGSFRTLLEHWQRLIDCNPGQFIFEPDRFSWREWRGVVERCNRHIDRVGILCLFEK